MKKIIYFLIICTLTFGIVSCGIDDNKKSSDDSTKIVEESRSMDKEIKNYETEDKETDNSEIMIEEVLNHEVSNEADFQILDTIIVDYLGEDMIVIIPEIINGQTVEAVSNIFANDIMVKGVVLPDTITEVEETCFGNNKNIQIVILGDNVKTIERSCFLNCTNLRQIILNDGLENIELFALDTGSEYLTDITIPESVTTIHVNAFGIMRDKVTLHVKAGSYAEQYAKDNNIKYVVE